MKLLISIFIFLVPLQQSVSINGENQILADLYPGPTLAESFGWLIGTWENRRPRGSIFERWEALSDNEFAGIGYTLRGQDTTVLETLQMVKKNDQILYIPTIPDQNDGKPVTFTSTYISSGKLIFEAPEHDFPQVITYTRVAADEIVAEVAGTLNGEYSFRTFKMNRYPTLQSRNVEIAKTVFEFFNVHDWEQMANLYSDPAEFKDPSYGMDPVNKTRKEIIQKYEDMKQISPDIKDEIATIYPSGDKHIIVEFISSGTAPNGTAWKLPLVTIFTIEEGLIVKDYTYYDSYK